MKDKQKESTLLALALMLGATAAASAGPIAVSKLDRPMKYGQNAMHGPLVGGVDVHALVPGPAINWDSPVTLTGVAGPGADSITATHRARHRFAPHAGEATPGPWWNAPAISPPVGGVAAITLDGASGTRNHGHTDYFNHMIVALWGLGGRIVGYAYASSAAHDPISCSAKAAGLRGNEAIPPAHSQACAAASLIFDAGTDTFVISVSVFGIAQNTLLSAAIHSGMPGQEGPMIYDLGPPSQWTDMPGQGMSRVVEDATFPVAHIADLLSNRTYVVIRTINFPTGELRGQLVDQRMVLAGDVNEDGVADGRDIAAWVYCALTESTSAECAGADLDGDGQVNDADKVILVSSILGS